ncbi:TRF-like 8 putative isoform 1 [Tripterygium wilfordii]|uniref:TRF-like 8 putative isoform 1 n=1 Tax=Tripterygium wilfordii TaxID=458696 RepID=A0A7J7DVR5_TRIWF|nr:uncharacterized protein LOC119990106 [Tripterygium wilfordii]XP_038691883.1 uncharacterized protein LOC119990106 [Tripterygium wilfordii]XP_038691891.1 uncharacterized protein LOC119990106 [Tripterygium wilfordii]KAF5750391.1 TRF-like 8 putative isoform 1 [Tripterygium wilfordii]
MTKTNVDESAVPAIKNEAVEVENLHAEPKRDPDSLDSILRSEKCLQMGEYPFGYDFDLKSCYGVLDSGETREGEHDLKLEVLDGLLDEVDEVDDIHAANDLSTACTDFLWDIEYVEKVSEFSCPPREGSRFRNPPSESHSPGCSGSSNGANGVSDTSTATILESGCKNDLLENVAICELHIVSRSECGCHLPVQEQICLSSPDTRNLDDLDNDEHCIIVNGMSSDEKEKNFGASISQKRLRKPTRRFIEEFSKPKLIDVMEIQNIPTGASKDKYLKVESCKEHQVRVVADQGEGPLSGTGTLTSHETRPRRGRPKKFTPVLDLLSEDELSDFDDEHVNLGRRSKTVADRRKHQRMWTLSEVLKLVDGVSQYGVGRWTDIKRLFFASSAYRTPVDLRDKWRNLLRACSLEKQKQKNGRKEIEDKLKHAVRPLPKSVLCRIRELATVHPYPKDRNTKLSRGSHVSPPTVSSTEVDLASPVARNVRRKKSS